MNLNVKLVVVLLMCFGATACTTTQTHLNRDVLHQERIGTVNLNSLGENVSIELADSSSSSTAAAAGSVGGAAGGLLGSLIGSAIDASTNANRKKAFSGIQESTDVMSASMVLKNALEHYLEGDAFKENLVVDSEFDRSIRKPYLVPVLTPKVTMSADYSELNVLLFTSMAQKSLKDPSKQNQYRKTYFSKQLVDNGISVSSKKEKKQFWIDNPTVLREWIVDGLYDVSRQFADDFNFTFNQ